MKKIYIIVAALFMCFITVSCGDNNSKKAEVFYHTYSADENSEQLRISLNEAFDDDKIKYANYNADMKTDTQINQIEKVFKDDSAVVAVSVVPNSSREDIFKIADMAKSSDVPLLFFGNEINSDVLDKYNKILYVGTDEKSAAQMQGKMIGDYLTQNYELTDLNGDGRISYVMLKGHYNNSVSELRTKLSVDTADGILAKQGKPAIEYFDSGSENHYYTSEDGSLNSDGAYNYVKKILETYNEQNYNMIELIVANTDEQALGAISALQEAGYNTSRGNKIIPVFGVDATAKAQSAIYAGIMTGSVRHDTGVMAEIIAEICENIIEEDPVLDGIDQKYIAEKNRIIVPCKKYYGKKNI